MSRFCCDNTRDFEGPLQGRLQRIHANVRDGLTLLELVVVLGILAMLSTVAVRSLEPIADQARYEVTQRVLDDVRGAISGETSRQFASGQTVISGFIADTGTLPTSVNNLLVRPVGLNNHTVQNFDSDRNATNDVTLSSGWKGPYLQLGAGFTSVVDGWGREPSITVGAGGLDLTSLGSDGDSVGAEDGYRADILVPVPSRNYRGDVVLRLFAIDTMSGLRIDPAPVGTERLGVLFYAVNAAGGIAGLIEEQLLIVPNAGSFEVRRSNTFHGTVAARAIQWNDVNNNSIYDVGETLVKKSYVHYLLVNPATDNRVEMELR